MFEESHSRLFPFFFKSHSWKQIFDPKVTNVILLPTLSLLAYRFNPYLSPSHSQSCGQSSVLEINLWPWEFQFFLSLFKLLIGFFLSASIPFVKNFLSMNARKVSSVNHFLVVCIFYPLVFFIFQTHCLCVFPAALHWDKWLRKTTQRGKFCSGSQVQRSQNKIRVLHFYGFLVRQSMLTARMCGDGGCSLLYYQEAECHGKRGQSQLISFKGKFLACLFLQLGLHLTGLAPFHSFKY